MRRTNPFSVSVAAFVLTSVLATAADNVQEFRSENSILSIYSYGGRTENRIAPELGERNGSRRSAPLSDVVAMPPIATTQAAASPSRQTSSATPRAFPVASPNSIRSASKTSRATPKMTMDSLKVVTVSWDPSPDATVVGYQLYTGTTSRNYTVKLPVGDQTWAQITVNDQPMYIAVSAYTSDGLESVLSEELVIATDPQSAAAASGLSSGSN